MPTPAILAIQSAVTDAGIPVTGKPVVVKRKIKNTSLWSQHSYGNAIDYYGTPGAMENLYQSLLLAKKNGGLPVATLCYNNRGGCTTSHKTHVHVDGSPHQTGTPGDRSSGSPIPDTGFDLDPIAGARESLLPGNLDLNIGNPFAGITDPLNALTLGIARLFDPETYLRVLWFIGGALLTLMGIVWIARELGVNIPKIMDLAAFTPTGAVAKVALGG